jgi:hypothetical protein
MACSRKSTRFADYHTQLRKAIRAFLPSVGLPLCSPDRRVRWSDRMLVIALVLLTWHAGDTLHEAFAAAREAVVALYPTRRRPGAQLNGFLKAWRQRSAALLTRVVARLRQRTQQRAGAQWRWKEWTLLGVDGSRINCPRTVANEAAFGCAGKRKTTPQQLLVTLFHVPSGLPWAWRRTRGDGSERELLLQMASALPERTLLLADAGFTGYALLRQLQAGGHAFVVRAGRNVNLLRGQGYRVKARKGRVYLWPHDQRSQPPLELRLVTLVGERRRVALLTNVLDEPVLSDAEVGALYRERWDIEVMYRSLKQTLGKRKLRADTPALARCELDWAMVGLWLLGLLTLRETGLARGWSPAGALQVVRTALRRGRTRTGATWLRRHLRAAVPDAYRRARPKAARDWPHKKTERPPGEPKVRMATLEEIGKIRAFLENNRAA